MGSAVLALASAALLALASCEDPEVHMDAVRRELAKPVLKPDCCTFFAVFYMANIETLRLRLVTGILVQTYLC